MDEIQHNVMDRFVLMQRTPIQRKYIKATEEEAKELYAKENVETFGDELMIDVPGDSRRKQYVSLVEAIKTESTLKGKIASVFVDEATHMVNATILYGDFRIIIPISHLLRIMKKDIEKHRLLENGDQLNFLKMLGKMRIGSVVDFIPRQIHEKEGFVIASRLMALNKVRNMNYIPQRRKESPKVMEGSFVQARVCYVKKTALGVEVGGVETEMRQRDISHQRITNVQELYKPGDYVLVKVTGVKYVKNSWGDIVDVVVNASAKEAVRNPQIENFYNYKLYESVTGVVKQRTVYGLFVRLDDSECDVMCYPEKDLVESQRADVGDRVVVKIIKKDEEAHFIWGVIQWNYSKNIL